MIPDDKNGGNKQHDSEEVNVTVVDRRHHATGQDDAVSDDKRSPYPSFIEELKSRADRAEEQARAAVVKAESEIDAVRARLQRDVERRVDEGRSRLLGAVLEVLDNLDRAKEVASSQSDAMAEGVELIRQQVLAILKAEGVEPIEMVGQEYDPNLAEAVSIEKVDDARHDLVLEEIRRGYLLGEKVLRPARVKVGKKSS